MSTISIGSSSKPAQIQFIDWLSGLLNNYESGFWDWSVKNMISMAFIQQNQEFLQEMYQAEGMVDNGFIITGALNTTSPQILYFDKSGVPTMHNDTDCGMIFEFTDMGRLTKFYENIEVIMYDGEGNGNHKLVIQSRMMYGIRLPFLKLLEVSTNALVGEGLLDVYYDNRMGSTYSVVNTPLEDLQKFTVRNKTNLTITTSIPILKDLELSYAIRPNRAALVPVTKLSEYFLRTAVDTRSVEVKLSEDWMTSGEDYELPTF